MRLVGYKIVKLEEGKSFPLKVVKTASQDVTENVPL